MSLLKYVLTSTSLFFTLTVHAWVYSADVTVVEIIQWQDNSPLYFKLSNGTMCYVPNAEKSMFSQILSLYVTGKRSNIHCADGSDSYGGIAGHRVHRIVSTN